MSIDFPSEYKRFSEINFCGNVLRGIDKLIEFHGIVPLLIGKGIKYPLVWLKSPTDISRDTWSYVVEKNKLRHPKFIIQKQGTTVTIYAGDTLVLDAYAQTEDRLIISKINFEPIGLRLIGDNNSLKVGSNTLQRTNVISGNGGSFISIGKK